MQHQECQPKEPLVQCSLENNSSPQDKLAASINQMEASLSCNHHPDFKRFWEQRNLCLDLFKENIPAALKAVYWTKYRELAKQAKRLKDMFEEQEAYASEQIELAISALEKEVEGFDEKLNSTPNPAFPKPLKTLAIHMTEYCDMQRELDLLNTEASRIHALRKELIKMEMRIRQKNLFFQRLSSLGDKVFPKRKALIQKISQLFVEDVALFVKNHFPSICTDRSLMPLREEIKALQATSKIITLNGEAFAETRKVLSDCWDKMRVAEQERKKEYQERVSVQKENARVAKEKVYDFSVQFSSGNEAFHDCQTKHEELVAWLRAQDLIRDDAILLKDELNKAFAPFKEKLLQEEKKRKEEELAKEEKRQAEIQAIEENCQALCETLHRFDKTQLVDSIGTLEREIAALSIPQTEQASLLRQLEPAKDALEQQDESAILHLPDSDSSKLSQLETLFKKRISKRNQIREQMDKYRKICGSSGLDFEQSLYFSDLLNREKLRLEILSASLDKLGAAILHLKQSL